MTALIDNLTDKACTKNKTGPSGSALYGQKSQDNNSKSGDKGKGKGKGKNKDKTPYKHYGIPGTRHEPDDCLALNEKKCKEWKAKNKKK